MNKIAFRGGTAINKLLFRQALRYSEDIDLVQTQAGHSMHLVYKFRPETDTQATLKLKIEINTREHEHLLRIKLYPFAVESDWYRGKTEIASFEPEELFGTKLRALLQRRKNRDLFSHTVHNQQVVACNKKSLFWKNHESNSIRPKASNFAVCMGRRFAGCHGLRQRHEIGPEGRTFESDYRDLGAQSAG